ncbi:MAG: exosortase/archaeosortase family protein [Kiritimatiellia bacterium]
MEHLAKSRRLILFLATAGSLLYGFSGMFARVAQVFSDAKEDMSFGWLVPFFSLYVLWTQRRELRAAVGAPSLWGLVASVPFFLLALLGTRGIQIRLEQVGFIGLCVTVPWAFFGGRLARLCVFPAAYLAFTIPVGAFLDFATIHLRLLASGTAMAVLKGFGVDAVQRGTAICSQGAHAFSIDVAEPCSGLRSLFALMALTAAYAWYHQPTWPRRAALFACSIPLAVLGNVVRILSICLFAAFADPEFAMGFYHDYSGYVVFLVAIVCMVGCDGLITRFAKGRPRPAPEAAPAEAAPAAPARPLAVPVAACALLAALSLFQASTPRPVLAAPPAVELPDDLPGYPGDGIRYCQEEPCARSFPLSRLEPGKEGVCPACGGRLDPVSLGERTILPDDTDFRKRIYQDASGVRFTVSVVVGGASKSSIHRPELCLPAQGFQMSNPWNFTVEGWPFHAVQFVSAHTAPGVLAYTFFNQAGVHTASHTRRIFVDTWDRSVLNRIDRWVMVTVDMSADGRPLAQTADSGTLERFLAALVKGLKP